MQENPFPSLEMTERHTGLTARLRLSTNENEFGPAPEVLEALREAAARDVHRYPDCDHFALRRRLAGELAVDQDRIHVGPGVDGLLSGVCRAFLGPGRTAVTSEASYPTFAYFAEAAGATVHSVRYRRLRVDVEALARRAWETDAAVVYVADPDNPTGSSLGARSLLELAAALPPGTLLVTDGAYAEYQPPDEQLHAGDVLDRRMLWLRTFSKAHALAGLRIGYAVGRPDLLRSLRRGSEHYAVGRIAETAALSSLDAVSHLASTIRLTAEGRDHYARGLGELGFTVLPGAANFVTFRCGTPAAAGAITAGLMASGVFVRRPAQRDVADCVRLSIGPSRQRRAVLGELVRLAPVGRPAASAPAT